MDTAAQSSSSATGASSGSDSDSSAAPGIAPAALAALRGAADPPLVFDLRKPPAFEAADSTIEGAARGAITSAVIAPGKCSLIDLPTVLPALAAALPLWRFKKLPESASVLAAAPIGLFTYPLLH